MLLPLNSCFDLGYLQLIYFHLYFIKNILLKCLYFLLKFMLLFDFFQRIIYQTLLFLGDLLVDLTHKRTLIFKYLP